MGPAGRLCLAAGGDADPPALASGRVHELCGPARRTLAILWAAAGHGPVVWIAPAHASDRLHAPGVAGAGLDPGRLTLVDATRPEDILWSAEESLRHLATAGAGGLVVAEPPAPPALTPVRRLHLAAAGDGAPAGDRPLGLVLSAGDGGAQGVESRWHLAPDHGPAHSRWRLERRRARGAPPAAWRVEAPAHGPLRLHRLGAPDGA